MTKALVFGVNGQDGSYLAELLISKGVEVIGWLPSNIPQSTTNISHILDDIKLIKGNLTDFDSLRESVNFHKPDEIYNLASPSSPYASWQSSLEVSDVTALGAARLLEIIRIYSPQTRFYQASSSEIFGNPEDEPQNEDTPFRPRNPYGIAKLFAHCLTMQYRQKYGLYAVSGILYNHESPRRGLDFVSRKITHTAAKIKLGLENELRLGNLEARRDWGYAYDYMEAIWLMMHQSSPEDYIIGSGNTHSVREFCELAFGFVELDYKDFVVCDDRFYRPLESKQIIADFSKAANKLKWEPKTHFKTLVKLMIEADREVVASQQQR